METSEREGLILSLAKSVSYWAAYCYTRAPKGARAQLFEDLTQIGWLGAIKAVDNFDSTQGYVLHTYGDRVIRGAILDYVYGPGALARKTEGRRITAGSCVYLTDWHARTYSDDRISVDILNDTLDTEHIVSEVRSMTGPHAALLTAILDRVPQHEIAKRMALTPGRISQMVPIAVQRVQEHLKMKERQAYATD